ncbi:uncharacterized protein [Miscanthus floridulus]|uniref:uncharacterized protein n=1 Tax=Miscanthus floridulus TaxID=154761 RepID=UPI003458CF70
MSTPGSRAMAAGLTVMLLSISAGMHFGGFGLLLCFMGVLIGANLLTVAVRMADGPALIAPVVFGGAALAAFVRRNITIVGLVMASCVFTAVSGEYDPVFCFGMFALLLLGLTLVNIGALGLTALN